VLPTHRCSRARVCSRLPPACAVLPLSAASDAVLSQHTGRTTGLVIRHIGRLGLGSATPQAGAGSIRLRYSQRMLYCHLLYGLEQTFAALVPTSLLPHSAIMTVPRYTHPSLHSSVSQMSCFSTTVSAIMAV
jgi:hypothetical protein